MRAAAVGGNELSTKISRQQITNTAIRRDLFIFAFETKLTTKLDLGNVITNGLFNRAMLFQEISHRLRFVKLGFR